MGMNSSTANGFGYVLYNGDNNREIVDFLKKHVKKETCRNGSYDKIQAMDPDFEDSDDMMDELEIIFNEPVEIVIADIINRETGCTCFSGYIACGDTDVDPHIGFCPSYPWEGSDTDRQMTEEDVTEILKRYGEELGITERPDYFSLEYYG